MKERLKDRALGVGNKLSTALGTTVAAALTGATAYWDATHNITSWEGYALAAAAAVAGTLYKKKAKG